MTVPIEFYSYFRDLAGRAETTVEVPDGATLAMVLEQVYHQHPALQSLRRSTLAAVGVDYQTPDYRLKEGDAVALFPPVQGG